MSITKLETATGGMVSIPKENFDTLEYDEKETTSWYVSDGVVGTLNYKNYPHLYPVGWYYDELDLATDSEVANGVVLIETFDTAKKQAEIVDTISAEEFLQREMTGSEINYEIDTANFEHHRTVDLDLTMETNGALAVSLILPVKGTKRTLTYVDAFETIAEMTEFANLILLAATIAQKWQAHCGQK